MKTKTIAQRVETVLKRRGCLSTRVYVNHDYSPIATIMNQLVDSQLLDAASLVITCSKIDFERVKTATSMIPSLELLSVINHFDSEMLLYGSSQS